MVLTMLAWLLLGPAAAAPGDGLKPIIRPRKEWLAEAADKIPFDKVKVRIVVHHTAFAVPAAVKTLGPTASLKASIKHAHLAQSLHKHIRGWSDVGYHYLIDWDGRIWEGRPVDRLGAHTEHNNRGSIGIVLMGDFSKERPTDKQVSSLKALVRWLLAVHGIAAKNIQGHQHLKFTLCPGKYLNDPWDPLSPLMSIRTSLMIEAAR